MLHKQQIKTLKNIRWKGVMACMNTEHRSPENIKVHVNLARQHPRKLSAGAVFRLYGVWKIL